MRRHSVSARTALLLLLLAAVSGSAAAERTGTPRMGSGAISIDRGLDFDPWPGPAPVNTLVLGSWTFGTPPSCTADGWTSVDLTAGDLDFGDYAGLFTGRSQHITELCLDNLGCLWGFHNGSADTYACGGGASQPVVPDGDAQRGYIWNEIQSPMMTLSGTGSVFSLRFTVYRHLRFTNLVFYTWRVRSWHAGTPGEWKSNSALYYGPTVAHGDWLIQEEQIGALIEPGADQIQVALGVIDMAGVWGGLLGDGACHSNAPYFDSVKVFRAASSGPQWSVDFADLFQDNFATDGTATGTVRMDMARDIRPRDVPSIQPGDSVVVAVSEPMVGLALDALGGPAVYLHVRDRSGGKSGNVISGDPLRWPVVSTGGGWTTLRFDSVRTTSGTVPDRYCVDLNDDLYTPGDTVLFYFSARDAAGRTTYWSEFTGTKLTPPDDRALMEATCLPIPDHNGMAILLVDDTDGSGGQSFFDGAFQILGIASEVDRYDVRGWHELVGNGPGSRVRNVETQLADYYDTIIWSSGAGTAGLIGDGSGMPEKSPDAAMLVEFLQKQYGALLYITGDQVASELKRLSSPSALELLNYVQYDLVAETHQLAGAISPRVISTPQSVFTHNGVPDTFTLFGGCAQLNSFCLLAPSGPSAAEMLYATSQPTPYAAEVSQYTDGDWVLLSGFGFEYVRDDELDGVSDRAKHLNDMFKFRDWEVPCNQSTIRIEPEDTGAKITWGASYCGRLIRVIRTADWAGTNEIIHTVAVPPQTGVFHDPIPYGRTAYYRIEVVGSFGRLIDTESATITRDIALTEFQARVRGPGIEVTWSIEDRTGIESLVVERRVAGEGDFAPASEDSLLPPASSRFVDTDFTPGARYEYRLAMRYEDGWRTHGGASSVEAPRSLTLGQNSPNPFNPATRIPFLVPSAGNVEVAIFNVNGQRVRTVWKGTKNAGYTEVEWDGRNDAGAPAASGIYFCRLSAFGQNLTRKIVLVR